MGDVTVATVVFPEQIGATLTVGAAGYRVGGYRYHCSAACTIGYSCLYIIICGSIQYRGGETCTGKNRRASTGSENQS
jgi:hypothetical protein